MWKIYFAADLAGHMTYGFGNGIWSDNSGFFLFNYFLTFTLITFNNF